jgi:hypothetical protein
MGGLSDTLRDLESLEPGQNVFVELLACEGGCVNGPKSSHPNPIGSQLKVHAFVGDARTSALRPPAVEIDEPLASKPIALASFSEQQIREALWRIGKEKPEDELNCGGCGYNSCRELACALLAGMAEQTMCVSYMRQLAQKKANALMRSAPFGVVIVDAALNVVDSNERFARLIGPDAVGLAETVPGLAGIALHQLVPFPELFTCEIQTRSGRVEHSVRLDDKLLNVTLFTIEAGRVVGAILEDVTQVETRREEIVQKAQQVIEGTLATVQDIAFRLGKNAADSEVILNSIIECFGSGAAARAREKR